MISIGGSVCTKEKIVFNTHNLTIKIKSLITNGINKIAITWLEKLNHMISTKNTQSSWIPHDNCFNYQIRVVLLYFYLDSLKNCYNKTVSRNCGAWNTHISFIVFLFFIWNRWLMRLQKHSAWLTFTFNHELSDKYRRSGMLFWRMVCSLTHISLFDANKLEKPCRKWPVCLHIHRWETQWDSWRKKKFRQEWH